MRKLSQLIRVLADGSERSEVEFRKSFTLQLRRAVRACI